MARIRQVGCASSRPAVSTGDAVRSATVMIGGTLAFTLLWLWTQWQFRESVYLEAVGPMAFLLPYLLNLHFTSLKGRTSAPSQSSSLPRRHCLPCSFCWSAGLVTGSDGPNGYSGAQRRGP